MIVKKFIYILIFSFGASNFLSCSKTSYKKASPIVEDNCISICKYYFPSNDMLWSFEKSNIANYYNLYLDLMNFWKTKFNKSMYDINYEYLVQSPEQELKKIFSFCNLTWDPNCLNFYKMKKTPISTVSVNQASKPIYKSSVNSNAGFSKYLTAMFHNLDTKK